MNGQYDYRFVLLLVAVLQNGLAFYYLRKAHAMSSVFQRRAEGIWLSAAIGGCFLAYCGAVIVYLVNPIWMYWSALVVPDPVRWMGLAPLLFGAAFIFWGTQHLAENFTVSIETKHDQKLVTSGPYRWVRHPLYAGLLIETVGVSLFVANWFVAISGAAMWALLACRTRMEEENLIAKFGDEYRQYRQRVGMFLPYRRAPSA